MKTIYIYLHTELLDTKTNHHHNSKAKNHSLDSFFLFSMLLNELWSKSY